jgi:transposase-like protein
MGERDVVWEHGENLFPRFKCKYCVKEFRGDGGTRLKEQLAEKVGMLHGTLNAHRTYVTTSYVSCKGSESERRP